MGELQPLLHSTSDSMLRKLVVSSGAQETTIDMEAVNGVDCDSDSNKTEVEEIEMVDMEGRAEVLSEEENTPLLAARHRTYPPLPGAMVTGWRQKRKESQPLMKMVTP